LTSADDVLNGDDVNRLINDGSDVATQSSRTANTQQLIKEQHEDKSLANCWSLAKRDKAVAILYWMVYSTEKRKL